jgi:hypothetical protein
VKRIAVAVEEHDRLQALELVGRVLLTIVPHGAARSHGILGDERHREDFGLQERARLIGGVREDDVGNAVACLIGQLGRRAPELHGGVDATSDATF